MNNFNEYPYLPKYFTELFHRGELIFLNIQEANNQITKEQLKEIEKERIQDIEKLKKEIISFYQNKKNKFNIIKGGGNVINNWPKPILRRIK